MATAETQTLRTIYSRYGIEMQYKAQALLQDSYEAQGIVQRALKRIAGQLHKHENPESSHFRAYALFTTQSIVSEIHPEHSEITEIGIAGGSGQFDRHTPWERSMTGLKSAFVEVLTLHHYYGYGVGEIAEVLSISQSDASTRLADAERAWRAGRQRGIHSPNTESTSDHESIMELEKIQIQKAGFDYTQQLLDAHAGKEAEIEATVIPAELNAWFEAFLSDLERKDRQSGLRKFGQFIRKRTVLLLAVIMISTAAFVMNVEPVRIRVMDMFIAIEKQFNSAQIIENDGMTDVDIEDLLPARWKGAYYPTYVPKHFVFEYAKKGRDSYYMRYVSPDDTWISLRQFSVTSHLQLDTEDAITADVEMHGSQGLQIIEGDRTMILWYNQEYGFLLTSYAGTQETLKMAESIRKR